MKKAKLGISVSILGAAVYFLGLVNTVPLVILAGYILIVEEDSWLRKAAVKAVAIVLTAVIVVSLLGLLSYVFDFLNVIIGWVHLPVKLGYPLNLDDLIKTAVYFIRDALLIGCGISALSGGSVKTGRIDSFVDKNM
jgi:hypothetical protein